MTASAGFTTKGDGYSLTHGDDEIPAPKVTETTQALAALYVLGAAPDGAAGARDVVGALGLDQVKRAAIRTQISARRAARAGGAA